MKLSDDDDDDEDEDDDDDDDDTDDVDDNRIDAIVVVRDRDLLLLVEPGCLLCM